MTNLVEFNHEKSEPGIIANDGCGQNQLIMIDGASWAACIEPESKRDLLLKLGKLLGYSSWIDVRVNMALDDNSKVVIIKREYCAPDLYNGEVIYFSPSAIKEIEN